MLAISPETSTVFELPMRVHSLIYSCGVADPECVTTLQNGMDKKPSKETVMDTDILDSCVKSVSVLWIHDSKLRIELVVWLSDKLIRIWI